jgi:hypothetical protein
MADAGEPEETRARPATPTARMEFVDSLPGGRFVLPVETDGEIVWLVLRGQMTEQLFGEINEYLALITGNGLWSQNWGASTESPPQ